MEDWTRPDAKSLRLLPFGPDRVGECIARASLPWIGIEAYPDIGKKNLPVTADGMNKAASCPAA